MAIKGLNGNYLGGNTWLRQYNLLMIKVPYYDILCWRRILVKYLIFNILYASVQPRLATDGVVVLKSGYLIKIGYKSFV